MNSPLQERWLLRTAWSLADDATIVEIGSFKGRSTCCMAYACRSTRKRVYCVDTFLGTGADSTGTGGVSFFEEWRANVARNGLLEYVTPIVGDSRLIGPGWGRQIDMLFIDGSHAYEDARADFDNFFPHVRRGGIVALHDVIVRNGPSRVWEERKHLLARRGMCSTLAFGRKLKDAAARTAHHTVLREGLP